MTQNEDKGRLFEDYIYSKLERGIEARRIREGAYSYPDMVCVSRHGDETVEFAVECKYRSNADGDIQVLDSARQWERYKQYHRKQRIMFIVIGTGGTPVDPGRIFIVPLMFLRGLRCNINQLHLFEHWDKSKYIKFYHNARSLR